MLKTEEHGYCHEKQGIHEDEWVLREINMVDLYMIKLLINHF